MKKVLFFLLPAMALILGGCRHASDNYTTNQEEVEVEDATADNEKIVEQFFTEFQQTNDGWTKTTEGHQKLIKAFEEKMTSDIEFAKAVATYKTDSYGIIFRHEMITPYEKGNGEEGEFKAFELLIPIKLIKPLYNGEKEIKVCYEIITPIPSTIEDHTKPYIDKANDCSVFTPYFKGRPDGALYIGSFAIAKKD